jgi:hypothetical protein
MGTQGARKKWPLTEPPSLVIIEPNTDLEGGWKKGKKPGHEGLHPCTRRTWPFFMGFSADE